MPVHLKVDVDVDTLVRSLHQFEDNGKRYVDESLRSLAHDVARRAAARAPGSIGARIRVWGEDMVYLVGAHGNRVPNWLNYGTLGNRLKGKTSKPGRKYDRSPGTGIKPRQFLKKPPAKVIHAEIVNGIVRAAKRAGFDVTRKV